MAGFKTRKKDGQAFPDVGRGVGASGFSGVAAGDSHRAAAVASGVPRDMMDPTQWAYTQSLAREVEKVLDGFNEGSLKEHPEKVAPAVKKLMDRVHNHSNVIKDVFMSNVSMQLGSLMDGFVENKQEQQKYMKLTKQALEELNNHMFQNYVV